MLAPFLIHLSICRSEEHLVQLHKFQIRDTRFENILDAAVSLSREALKRETIYERVVPTDQVLDLTSTKFYFCRTTRLTYESGDGGAVFMKGAQLNAQDCSFRENAAFRRGGAVYIRSSSKAQFLNCIFDGNSAGRSSGAGYFAVVFDHVMKNSNFSRNACKEEIGAVSFSVCLTVGLSHVVYFKNTAQAKGALFNAKSKMFLNESYFFANNATNCTAVYLAREARLSCVSTYFGDRLGLPSIYGADTTSLVLRQCFFSQKREIDIDLPESGITDKGSVFGVGLAMVTVREYPPIAPLDNNPQRDGQHRDGAFDDLEPETRLKAASVMMISAYVIVISLLVYALRTYLRLPKAETVQEDQQSLFRKDPRPESSSDDRPLTEVLSPLAIAQEGEGDEELQAVEKFATTNHDLSG